MYWLISLTTAIGLAAIVGTLFFSVVFSMRLYRSTVEVLGLGMAALGLMIASMVFPSEIARWFPEAIDSLRPPGVMLIFGYLAFAFAYMGFVGYYVPHSDAINNRQPYTRTWLEGFSYWVSYVLFFVAAGLWIIAVPWVFAILIYHLINS